MATATATTTTQPATVTVPLLYVTKRTYFDCWETEDGLPLRARKDREWIPYVRYLVGYTRNGVVRNILPWSRDAHNKLIGSSEYFERLEDYPKGLPFEVLCYKQLCDKFFLDLVPSTYGQQARAAAAIGTSDAWRKLVRETGGAVDPGVLLSRCDDPRVLLEAKVLFHIREKMKDEAKVYFTFDDLPLLGHPSFRAIINTLATSRVIVFYDGKIALLWAHDQVVKSGLVNHPGFAHDARRGFKPCTMWNAERDGDVFDFERAKDGLINKGMVCVTMIRPPIRSLFSFPEIHEFTLTKDVLRAMLDLDSMKQRNLFVSHMGDWYLEPKVGHWTLVSLKTEINKEFTRDKVVFMCPDRINQTTGKVNYTLKFRAEVCYRLPFDVICDIVQPAVCCTYEDMLKVPTRSYERVILIGRPAARWKREAIRIAGNHELRERCMVCEIVKDKHELAPGGPAPGGVAGKEVECYETGPEDA